MSVHTGIAGELIKVLFQPVISLNNNCCNCAFFYSQGKPGRSLSWWLDHCERPVCHHIFNDKNSGEVD